MRCDAIKDESFAMRCLSHTRDVSVERADGERQYIPRRNTANHVRVLLSDASDRLLSCSRFLAPKETLHSLASENLFVDSRLL